jgi:DNA polymerase II large subunit
MTTTIASERVQKYYAALEEGANAEYAIASAARAKGIDPEPSVEIPLAKDICDRVEGLVGPKGIAAAMREFMRDHSREATALEACKWIVEGRFDVPKDAAKLAEQSVRTGLALLTEGVVAAPIDGVSGVTIDRNPDGSNYLSVYFAGPIRAAGGTAQAQAVLIADYTRRLIGLAEFRPTDDEVERYVEEVNLYDERQARLQYRAPDDEVRLIARNCPVCVTGDQTSEFDVEVYKNLERVKTNRVRGGMCLVVSEGIASKAAKVVKFAKEFSLGWEWLQAIVKVGKAKEKNELRPLEKFMEDMVAGRPVFAYPSAAGAFRLRYGRARNTGLNARGIHPATMYVLDEFPAVGTQIKPERPGKGMTVAPVDSIEPPVVRLRNGRVLRVDSVTTALQVKDQIEEVLFLGDLLVPFGDFLKSNHPIAESAWCEEWYALELAEAGAPVADVSKLSWPEAKELSIRTGVPLHPAFTFPYHDVSPDELRSLVKWLAGPRLNGPEKRTLEKLLVPHRLEGDAIAIDKPFDSVLEFSLGLPNSVETIDALVSPDAAGLLAQVSPVRIMKKAPVYVGARMGRPEKAKERLMSPAPHLLFPVGNYGGATRSVMKAYNQTSIAVEVTRLKCVKCKALVLTRTHCGERTTLDFVCPRCGRPGAHCREDDAEGAAFDKRVVNLRELVDAAVAAAGEADPKLKGVKGTMSATKAFEPIEKGIIRARNGVHIFKDGTLRFDATNLPLTHFKPREAGTSIEKLRELGYTHDIDGKELLHDEQIVELFPQDVIPSEKAAEWLLHATRFVDEELEKLYGLEPHFNCAKREDLIGQLIVMLAPHTSAGVVGRVIGFTKAQATLQHPLMIAACRRDCDGDEDAMMLLMDTLVNFSKAYLPDSRGGSMDAPLVLTMALEPSQVDDQVHEMDIASAYPLEFYRRSAELVSPKEFEKGIELVKRRLGRQAQYDGFGFTHSTASFDDGVTQTSYTKFKDMEEKVAAQLGLGRKIRAVNVKDQAERLLNGHFMRDIYGNLRAFGEQKFRCVECNMKHRRVPLSGKCKCGGKLILTIAEGSVRKYLDISMSIAGEFGLSDYVHQRLKLVGRHINSVFVSDKARQYSLAEFV